jgi:Uma2 family endonuclease
MATKRAPIYISPEEYWDMERKADFRSEYISGEILAMASPSKAHGQIIMALGGEIRSALRGRTCEVSTGISVAAPASYLVPDLVIYCDGGDFTGENDILRNPIVIIEVLSASTSGYDHAEKWMRYQLIGSLMYYVLVSQDEPRVEVFTREPDGGWHYVVVTGLESVISLSHIDCKVALADVYELVLAK